MKILEIKNNLIKLLYELDDDLALSGFVVIEDTNYAYVAQVVSLKTDGKLNLAIVRLIFTFDGDGVLKNHNGTIPSVNAAVSKLPANELLEVLPVETPIKLGALAQDEFPLFVDKSVFENNLIVCCNKQENINTFVNNMLSQLDTLNQKTVVIDVDGEFDYGYKFEFGYDFKLPLNGTALNYIFDNDLEDVEAKSRAVIQDIFYEVNEYSKTASLQFIPFETFIDVVDAQYRATNIPELILLKNKLLKYKEESIFALNSAEITALFEEIQKNNITVLNISKVDGELQKQVISYIYDVLSTINASVYVFIKLNVYNASKKLIKRFLQNGNAATTIICGHEFKYLQELKQTARNLLLFAPLTLQHDFASYNTYLAKLNPEEFIAFGDSTQEIPLIAELQEFSPEDLKPETYHEEDMNQEQETEQKQPETSDEELDFSDEFDEMTVNEYDDVKNNITVEPEEIINAKAISNDYVEEEINTEYIAPEQTEFSTEQYGDNLQEKIFSDNEIIEETFIQQPDVDKEIMTEQESVYSSAINEQDIMKKQPAASIVEPRVSGDAEIQPEIPETVFKEDIEMSEKNVDEEIDEEQIVRDVDNILYNNKKSEDDSLAEIEDIEEITEDDLNLIDDLNNAVQEIQETDLDIDPITEDADDSHDFPELLSADDITKEMDAEREFSVPKNDTPIVPIYPANDIPEATAVFEAGEQVTHPKYGTGVVEKMIKYGNKVLCSINFENIGRRLIDPSMSEIKKAG